MAKNLLIFRAEGRKDKTQLFTRLIRILKYWNEEFDWIIIEQNFLMYVPIFMIKISSIKIIL